MEGRIFSLKFYLEYCFYAHFLNQKVKKGFKNTSEYLRETRVHVG